jgi:aspartate racemase
VHEIIYQELCLGVVRESSRDTYRRVIAELAGNGAECVLLGCTEIGLLVGENDASVPVFDTTSLHARRAVEIALEGDGATGAEPVR